MPVTTGQYDGNVFKILIKAEKLFGAPDKV